MTAPGLFGDALRLSCNTRAASRSAPAAHHWPGPPHTSWGHLIPGRHLRKSDCLDLTICPLLRPVQSTYSDRPAQPGPGSETCHSSSALPTASSSVHTTSRPTQPAFVQPDTPPYRRPGLMLSRSRLRCHQGADSEPRQSPAREPAAARRKRVPDRGERLVPTLASLPSHYRKACTHGRDTVAKADNFSRPSKKPPPFPPARPGRVVAPRPLNVMIHAKAAKIEKRRRPKGPKQTPPTIVRCRVLCCLCSRRNATKLENKKAAPGSQVCRLSCCCRC